MPYQSDLPEAREDRANWFTTTHWSVVLAAGHGAGEERARALERLCQTYWRPLYLYVRRRGYGPDDAQDLTQEFFRGFLERNAVERADRARGRFRTFLLASLQNFLAKEWRKANTAKRGGGQPMLSLDTDSAEAQYRTSRVEELTPEKAYEKSWAVATLEEAMVNLQNEYQRSGKGELFEQLRLLLWEEPKGETYAGLGRQLAMSEAAVKMAIARLRQRARELLRREIAHTVASPGEVEEEFRYLVAVLRA
jgi:RNA polymerase sigma-70 factor (ECF subfamily)